MASASYGVAGETTGLSYFGLSESRTYNAVMQMTRQTVSGMMDMQYVYASGANNGRITQSIDGVVGETVNYTYDSLNRLTAAGVSGGWSQTYGYDGFGNMGQVDPATNRLNGQGLNISYDDNRNLLSGPGMVSGVSDVENRLVQQTLNGVSTRWAYDPHGKRIMKKDVNAHVEF